METPFGPLWVQLGTNGGRGGGSRDDDDFTRTCVAVVVFDDPSGTN